APEEEGAGDHVLLMAVTAESALLEAVRAQPVPAHVAIIMDGNGRWATQRGLPRMAGHREGVKAARAIVRAADAAGLRFLTLYAFRALARRVQAGELAPEAVSEADISRALYTEGVPDPDLLIRTSGEMRVSNFLLWQIAYTELWMTPTLWPDFGPSDLYRAIT